MDPAATQPREIAVPVSVFGALREELGKEAGPLPAIHALHHAGFRAGTESAMVFQSGASDSPMEMAQSVFWARLTDFFARRGWGTLTPDTDHRGVALLASPDWAEADPDDVDAEASCTFSTGFMSGMLTEVAGAPVAVLEVTCRTRGDDQCQFAFGSEHAIHDLYGRLLDGADLDAALGEL